MNEKRLSVRCHCCMTRVVYSYIKDKKFFDNINSVVAFFKTENERDVILCSLCNDFFSSSLVGGKR